MDEAAASDSNRSRIAREELKADLEGSSPPKPLKVPPPTFWPFITAVGTAICFWGAVLNLLVVGVGVCVFVIGMGGLVGDWVREHNEST
jgi:hypothetical protein